MSILFYTVFNKKSIKYKSELFKIFETYDIYNTNDISQCDAIFTIGGDGTTLPLVNKAIYYKKPIIGYNLTGHMGFITCGDDINDIITKYINGKLYKSKRLVASFVINDCEYNCLNEIYIKNNSDRLTKVKLNFDEVEFNSEIKYRCDGLIISTPTGSTAYNMSAGGPILYPTISNILSIVANAQYGLSSRPIIIPTNIKFTIESKYDLLVNFDNVDKITTKKIIYNGTNFYVDLFQIDGAINNIKNKLHWNNY